MAARLSNLSRFPRIPPGRHGLPREFVVEHQRKRLLLATANLVAKRGYRGTPLTRIASAAGVGRNTFYEHFSNKEACFVAMFDDGVERATRRVKSAAVASETREQQIHAGLAALLAFIAEEPALARACLVESLSADRPIVERYEATIRRLVPFFREGRSINLRDGVTPDVMEETIIRGIAWMIYQRLVVGETDGIESLIPDIVGFAFTPYLGDQVARPTVDSTRPTGDPPAR